MYNCDFVCYIQMNCFKIGGRPHTPFIDNEWFVSKNKQAYCVYFNILLWGPRLWITRNNGWLCNMLISSVFTLISLLALGIGSVLNGLEIWLIVFHSPKGMRVYSQILLQISAADILTLIITPLNQPVSDS